MRLTIKTQNGWRINPIVRTDTIPAYLARYEDIGSARQFKALDELNTPKSPYPDGDSSIMECPTCGSGEWLHNFDDAPMNFCGRCGQAIDWSAGTGT